MEQPEKHYYHPNPIVSCRKIIEPHQTVCQSADNMLSCQSYVIQRWPFLVLSDMGIHVIYLAVFFS